MFRVVHIARTVDAVHHVFLDECVRLAAQGVDAGRVVHVACVVMNVVVAHAVVGHGARLLVPSPSKTYSCVRHIAYLVVLDDDAAHVACPDAHASPVFVGRIADAIPLDGESCANLPSVAWVVGQVGFVGLSGKGTCQDGRAAYVGERAVLYLSARCVLVIVERRGSEMAEGAVLEDDAIGSVYIDRRLGTSHPALVVEPVVAVGSPPLWANLVGLGHVHPCLQWRMTLERGPQPRRMLEGDALEQDVADGSVRRAFHAHQVLQHRCLHAGRQHVLAWQRVVVETVGVGVEIPFPRLVEHAGRVGQIERGVVLAVGCHHGRWPGMHEVDVAFRIVESHRRTVAHHLYVLDAQVGYAPHFVQHHLRPFPVSFLQLGGEFAHGICRHVDGFFLLVHRDNPVHLLKVGHVACPHCLSAVHPQLSELRRPSVELGHVGHPEPALPPPSLDGHGAADDDIPRGHYRQRLVFGTDHDGLRQAVHAWLQPQNAPAAMPLRHGQARLLQGLLNGERTRLHVDGELSRRLHVGKA